MPFHKFQAGGTTVDPPTTTVNFANMSASKSGDITTLTLNAGAVDVTMAAGKIITPSATGGIAPSVAGFTSFWTAGVGVETAATGTDSACTNGDIYWCATLVPYNCTLTGISYLIGSVGGTDKAIVGLYSSAGVLLASSVLAGTTVGTAANWQPLDFTAALPTVGPALYYVALQFNGATAKFRTHAGPGQKYVANTVAGTFGTMAAITPGSSFVASKGPIAVTY